MDLGLTQKQDLIPLRDIEDQVGQGRTCILNPFLLWTDRQTSALIRIRQSRLIGVIKLAILNSSNPTISNMIRVIQLRKVKANLKLAQCLKGAIRCQSKTMDGKMAAKHGMAKVLNGKKSPASLNQGKHHPPKLRSTLREAYQEEPLASPLGRARVRGDPANPNTIVPKCQTLMPSPRR